MGMPEHEHGAGGHTHPEIAEMRGEMTAMEARHGARIDEMGTAHRAEVEQLRTEYGARQDVDAATLAAQAAADSAEAARIAAESPPPPAEPAEVDEVDETDVEVDPGETGEPPEKPKQLPAVPEGKKEPKSWADNYKWGGSRG